MDKFSWLKPNPRAIIQNIYAEIIISVVGAIPIAAIIAKLFGVDPLGIGALMSQPIALLVYFGITIIVAIVLFGIIRVMGRVANHKTRSVTWKLILQDFGIDSSNRHIIGFRIVEPQEHFHSTLEALWTCETDRDDMVVLWHHINATSRNLKNPSDGQFMLAIRFTSDPRFMLTLENGFYARLILSRYYRARVFIRDEAHRIKKCIDIIIHSTSPVSSSENDIFEVVKIEDADCNDSIDPPMGIEDSESKSWATEKIFQPNLW